MLKNDNRMYNRKQNRDLSIEMNLWCLLKGKSLEAKGCFFDGKPVCGIIKDIAYEVRKGGNYCNLKLSNGTEYVLRVKYGRIVRDDRVSIL